MPYKPPPVLDGFNAFSSEPTVSMLISPDSMFSDFKALLDSYAVRVEINEKVYCHYPLFWCPYHSAAGGFAALERPARARSPYPAIRVDLTAFEPTLDADDWRWGADFATRWPFYVEQKTMLTLVMPAIQPGNETRAYTGGVRYPPEMNIDWFWWDFEFLPGQNYTERTLANGQM